jgi:hypothetical protein
LYGSDTPPEFNLSNIKNIPIALLCGREDLLASPGDYSDLAEILKAAGSLVEGGFKEYD